MLHYVSKFNGSGLTMVYYHIPMFTFAFDTQKV